MSQAQIATAQAGASPRFLEIRNTYLVYFTNGLKRVIENVHYYGPGASQACGGPTWSASAKTGLVTYATGITSAGVAGLPTTGTPSSITTLYGFQQTVVTTLNACLNVGALSNGIFARWIDQISDADLQVGTFAPFLPTVATTLGSAGNVGGLFTGGGQIGSLATRMPLDNHVTMRKYTGVRGKEWSRGRWKFAPIDESHVSADELNATGLAKWNTGVDATTGFNLKTALYLPITDGTTMAGVANCLYPILVSTKYSQLRKMPTRIAYAPLVLPGINYITQVKNQILNLTIGEQRRRKEKPDLVI